MKLYNKPIYVTQPSLPPLEEFHDYLIQIWESKYITNQGPFHEQFEKELAKYLGVKYLSVFANGTLALITALHALDIKGEVITTPFSFVATSHALWWNSIKPVFVDIDSDSFNLDPRKVEAAITSKTTAILPVHVFGNPCEIESFQAIAEKYKLKLIYDAAHAFGVKINNNSILNYGDLSILSFHATKTFNTVEGGAIICRDIETKKRIDLIKNFGIVDEQTVIGAGLNAKMNELQAAYGIVQLKYVNKYIQKRKNIAHIYRDQLKDIPGLTTLTEKIGTDSSYTYYPILIDKDVYGQSRDFVYETLKKYNIFTRRYFHPLISHFPVYSNLLSANKENLKVAEKVASQILCLPIYSDLEPEIVNMIISLLRTI